VTGVLAHARRFHFVGIGGIGMSSLAELLLNLGYDVSGSDMYATDITNRLESLGARVRQGHTAANVGDAEVLVYSSAIKESNPELVAARERGLMVLPRAELLAELMGLRRGIAVAGAHGKTTTTSMIALVLEQAGLDPTAVIGGRVSAFGSNARLGAGEYLIAEADESDRSFLRLHPHLAVITNIDREHMEAYVDFADLEGAFVEFANRVPQEGAVVLCLDDPYLRALRASIQPRVITYGFSPDADVAGTDVHLLGFESSCVVRDAGKLRVGVPGRHNVLNALAAVAVGRELGIEWHHITRALESFRGAERRFQKRGEVNGIIVVDDYGHHPTEIAAVIAAARPIARGRLVAAFQPHRFTRTERLMSDFGPAFAGVDVLLLSDIYAASEDPIHGVTLQRLADEIRKSFSGELRVVPEVRDIGRTLGSLARMGDFVLLLGAGSIGAVWPDVLRHLEEGVAH
jgi:UDP-N-acetylmuramate--alanine ligase